jgi:hypothetical protein
MAAGLLDLLFCLCNDQNPQAEAYATQSRIQLSFDYGAEREHNPRKWWEVLYVHLYVPRL